jgi:hypothetical protein
MKELVKTKWCSGKNIVEDRGITIYELFDLMKNGLQAYTEAHEKVVDDAFILKPRQKLLEYIKAEVKREFATTPRSEFEIDWVVQLRYHDRTGGILDHPTGYKLMSFDEIVNNSLSKVWDFQFKTVDVDMFFDNEYNHSRPFPSYEEIQKEKERKVWELISDLTGVSPEKIQNVTADALQSEMFNNRSTIRAGSEENRNETDNSLLSIMVDNRSIIENLAGTEGTEGEREYLTSVLAGSEEIQNAINEYNQTDPIPSVEIQNKTASDEKIRDGNRDKNKDRKQCRDRAKKYVADCNAKKEIPSIAKAIKIILSLDCGKTYTAKQVRYWITFKQKIFPKDI